MVALSRSNPYILLGDDTPHPDWPGDPRGLPAHRGIKKKKSGVRNLIITAASLTGLMTLQVACGSAENSSLPGAVYAKVVPVYPGAKEDVVAFYKKNLPGAELKRDDAGDPTFTLIPDGAEEGEHVQVIFRKSGDLQIHESLKPGKRKG